jgi:O-antigen/teichoic acid export membrane protein/peptidoglycan/xylan/chitin deacetylase (PgdA/CDA1 family)
VSVLILARGLGPSGRGAIAFFIVTALVMARVLSLGVWEATTVFAAQRPERRPAVLTNAALFSAAAALSGAAIVCGALLLFAGARPEGLGEAEVGLLALGILGTAQFEAGFAFMLGCSRFRQTALIAAGLPWVYALMVALVLLAPGLSVASAAIAWTASALLGASLMLFASTRGVGLGAPSLSLMLESIRFGARAWVGSLSRFLNFRLDQILLGLIASEATLGIYAVAVNASEILLYLPGATASALVPLVARSEAGLRAERTLRAFRTVAMITGAGVILGALAGPLLVPLVFGGRYEPAVLPFVLLLPGALGYAASAVFSGALVASSSPGLSSVGPAVSLVTGLALDVLLIPPFGAEGAAVAASSAFLLGGAVATAVYRHRTGFARGALLPRRSDVELARTFAARLLGRIRQQRRDRGGLAITPKPLLRAKGLVTRARSVAWLVGGRAERGGDGVRILFYHRVSDDRDELAVSPRLFRRQMDFLAAEGWRVVDVVHAAELVARGEVDGRTLGLSFDDGYRDVADSALPVLEEHGFRATVFVATAVIDGEAALEWYEDPPPLLSWEQIARLDRASPLRFEAHSVTHPNLLGLEDERARAEIEGAKAALEARLGRPVEAFCYPAGLFGSRERTFVDSSGFRFAASCEPGVNLPGGDPLALRRIQIDARDRLLDFRAKVAGGHDAPLPLRRRWRRARYGAPTRPPRAV